MIQGYKLGEQDFRGTRFAAHDKVLKGCLDILCLTRPDIVREVHRRYLDAGADVIETNSFSASATALTEYGLASVAYDLNYAAAALARAEADASFARTGKRRWVAGSMGPTNRSASMSPDVSDPGFRAVTFADLRAVYAEQARGLIDGGADLLLLETAFDTLNVKAALFGITELLETMPDEKRPAVMVSVTITDQSGRTLSGQTVEAFITSVQHARPFALGINCAMGPEAMRPYLQDIARLAECWTSCVPNAGLPNAFGGYDESPPACRACSERSRARAS
jgi:5-methyltetrahydrofolate--homocysteine methyltransferase